MIAASNLEIMVGSRTLMSEVNFRVDKGDRVGLVGRNGAGKTTLTKVLMSEVLPSEGTVSVSGSVGYLPQDPRSGRPTETAKERVLGARDLDVIARRMRKAERAMSDPDPDVAAKAIDKYPRIEAEFIAAGGYAAESEALAIAANLGLDEQLMGQELQTLSGGQRRRVELARILFHQPDTMILDEPTNHLDAESVQWLRDYLAKYSGGLIIISHDLNLIEEVVNKVFYLDATRQVIDIYAMGYKQYLKQREADERRRKRERANAEKKASALVAQAEKMRAKATKAVAAQSMLKRAERMMAGLEEERQSDKVASLRFPTPAACGKVPLTGSGLSKSYGSTEVFMDVDLAIDRGSRVVILGFNGAGKTTLLKILAGLETPDTGEVKPGHGLKLGYYAQEHETLDLDRTVLENMRSNAPDLDDTQVRTVLGSFLFSGDDVNKPAKVLSGGEKTRLALATLVVSSANVLLLDEPTNNLDPASREEILSAIRRYEGAIILVTHDEGAVQALDPDRVLLLPDGDEDHWNDSYLDLVSLA
ncbi:ABC-F family ATP-binding cassette domain-containing protein [Brevibacterium sp. UMB1308A]|uniref:ribosomal protection-like ABC-F family protein n=1 Tax=Brevibacterium sp. UMB1308A TaxID=3050608 RepID=UPI00254F6BBA|nr:ABC-F family ATP-binding cassette domain-containing protein [Brevibacterium sp. UMB1308A]MDK8345338.1 ABC-F family ATP-binding cassette domain-containing protein [Brevibacterium sp. UMB1308B]MDK8713745.1 ABC-F family ATP-binding cassette domain-containing protein [Brevibacterium sp. UMB1308A]